MISSWLVKVVVGIALVGFLLIELGSPLVVRAQVDDAAHEIATQVMFRLRDSFTQQTLDTTCAAEAEERDVEATCTSDTQGNVTVTATKEARSVLLHKISALEDWYDVEVTATADLRR